MSVDTENVDSFEYLGSLLTSDGKSYKGAKEKIKSLLCRNWGIKIL
jgi:hypothetical protein